MKLFNTIQPLGYMTALMVAVMALALSACDESAISAGEYDAPLSLTGVRYASPDSSEDVEQIGPGDVVALEGKNMNSVAHVYLNGYEAAFNPALVTETHLIVTVPPDMPFGTMDLDSEVMNTIKVTNNTSEAVLDFKVLPPAPQLSAMSNAYADPGEEVTLYGQYLYLIETITLPDGTTISGEAVESAPDGSRATFTLPAEASEKAGAIALTSVSGSDVSTPTFAFHETEGVIFNLDDAQHWEWWSAMHPNDDSYDYEAYASYFAGTGAEGAYVIMRPNGTDITSGNNAWWNPYRSINLSQGMQWIDPANLGEPPSNYAVKFELAIEGTWSTGALLFRVANDEGWTYSARYEPWLTGDGSVEPVAYEGWRTVVLPLSTFRTSQDGLYGTGNPPATLSELLPNGVAPYPGLMLINDRDGGAIPAELTFAVDNIRVVHVAE